MLVVLHFSAWAVFFSDFAVLSLAKILEDLIELY